MAQTPMILAYRLSSDISGGGPSVAAVEAGVSREALVSYIASVDVTNWLSGNVFYLLSENFLDENWSALVLAGGYFVRLPLASLRVVNSVRWVLPVFLLDGADYTVLD